MFLYGSTEIARYNCSCNNKLLKKGSVIKSENVEYDRKNCLTGTYVLRNIIIKHLCLQINIS